MSATGTTTYYQQLALQQSNSTEVKNPRHTFYKDLMTWMKQAHKRGERFILEGDFNEVLISTSGLTKFCGDDTFKMIDVLGTITRKPFNTTKTGQQRINYTRASPEIHWCIKKIGYLPFDFLIFTNHCSVYLDLDTNTKQLDDLTLEARLNAIANLDANSFCINTPFGIKPFSMPTMFPSLKAFLKINGCTVTGKMKQFFHSSYTGSDVFEHTRTKTGLSIDNMNKIDWDNLGTMLERQQLFTK
eukprot:12226262-Ditylum_brightwellii.AAC.1